VAVSYPEVLVPHAGQVASVSQVRSTLLYQSVEALKRHGNYERWLTLVSPHFRDIIVESIAPSWLPVEVAVAHYRACDDLELSPREMLDVGLGVGERLQGTLIQVAVRMARTGGATPALGVICVQRIWPRLFIGGSFQAELVGPKDLQLEVRAAVLTRSSYFRGSMIGNLLAAMRVLGLRAPHVKLLPYDAQRDVYRVHMAWV
jgi:hypothetical protein